MSETALLWLRNDLRLADHEPLVRALEREPGNLAVVYCFDPRHFQKTSLCGFPKTGRFRARFLLESLEDLLARLRRLGNDLIVVHGLPETELPRIANRIGARWIGFHAEATAEETQVEQALARALEGTSIEFRSFWGSTLFHRDELPFAIRNLPRVFTQFRIRCEKDAKIRPPLPAPVSLPPPPPGMEFGAIPKLTDLGLAPFDDDPRSVMRFHGGESAALNRLEAYFWRDDRLKLYKATRNGLLGEGYSSKFSPWLALGCISPRSIAAEVARYETTRVRNDSTYWLVFELMWRDFFRFLALQVGPALFSRNGPSRVNRRWSTDREKLNRWIDGMTGVPFVDANMRELKQSGFMSNRGRQNVASFLAKDLNVDWRFGAEWFESELIDYDVCSNWGNWSYVAGVGNDPRQDRRFDVVKQGRDYDPKGEYVRTWLPELESVPDSFVHAPWLFRRPKGLPLDFGAEREVDYPEPMIEIERSKGSRDFDP